MCTRVVRPDADGSVVVVRDMDFHRDLMAARAGTTVP